MLAKKRGERACKPGSVPPCSADDAANLRRQRSFICDGGCPPPEATYPEVQTRRTASRACAREGESLLPVWSCSGWGLPSRPSHLGRWCALTAPFHPYHARRPRSETAPAPFGGLFSVALSLASRPVGVTDHPVLRSPDFPPEATTVAGPRSLRATVPLARPAMEIVAVAILRSSPLAMLLPRAATRGRERDRLASYDGLAGPSLPPLISEHLRID